MNMDNLDQAILAQNSEEFPPPKPRGWWSRNWLWFIPTLLLGCVLMCCGCPLGIGLWFLHAFPAEVFQMAMAKIEADEGVQQELGKPIVPVMTRATSFRKEPREADIRWEIAGPKGQAKAHVTARKEGDRWDMVVLEVTLADGRKISVAQEGGNVAAPFESKPAEKSPEPEGNVPAPEINLPAPPADMPDKS
jgi:hypothetical protein